MKRRVPVPGKQWDEWKCYQVYLHSCLLDCSNCLNYHNATEMLNENKAKRRKENENEIKERRCREKKREMMMTKGL